MTNVSGIPAVLDFNTSLSMYEVRSTSSSHCDKDVSFLECVFSWDITKRLYAYLVIIILIHFVLILPSTHLA
jgi:hypothetical protein